jgi:hypothetical protein
MVPASEAYSQKASLYEKMADDECASPEQRKLFARKANSMRVLARLEGKRAEAALRPINQNSVPQRMRAPNKKSLWSRITRTLVTLDAFGKGSEKRPDQVRRRARASA